MSNKFTLILEGAPYDIERRQDLILVNGVEFPVVMKEKAVEVSGSPKLVKISGSTAEVDGIAYEIEVKGLEEPKRGKERKAASHAAGAQAGAVVAIMPGLIIDIRKQEGDTVEAGEVVVILEAMKMQNELKAPMSGVIRQMNVKKGQNVEMRQVLCVIE